MDIRTAQARFEAAVRDQVSLSSDAAVEAAGRALLASLGPAARQFAWELAEQAAVEETALSDPDVALRQKIRNRTDLESLTELDIPGDRQLQESIDWSKQNLADAVQTVDELEIRETNAGENYPAPDGTLDEATFLAAGFPDYQWLFGTDGEYTAFAAVPVGQIHFDNCFRACANRLATFLT